MLTWNPLAKPSLRCVPIECRAGGFRLYLRMPNYAERLADEGYALQIYQGATLGLSYAHQVQARIVAIVTDWGGVQDEQGEPIPYTVDRLVAVLTEHPDAADQVSIALAKAYSDNPAQLGEFDAPSTGSGGADSPSTTDPSPTC